MLLAGYGGVQSIEKAFDGVSSQAKATEITSVSDVEGEHIDCFLNETGEGASESDALQVVGEYGKIRLGGVGFLGSLESGLEEAKSTGRPVFLYLHSRSCGWCKRFEEEVLSDPYVISTVETSFVPVAIEVNEQKDMAARFRVYGTPTMVFLGPDGAEIGRIRGFEDTQVFAAALDEMKELLEM